MNNTSDTENTDFTPSDRPLGFWLRVLENRMGDAMRQPLRESEIGRREWRVLATLGRNPMRLEQLKDAFPPRRSRGERADATRPDVEDERSQGEPESADGPRRNRPQRRPLSAVVTALTERGWLTETDGLLSLTPQGTEAQEALHTRIREVRTSMSADISEEDYATTTATLQTMARNLGWDPSASRGPRMRHHGRRHGFGGHGHEGHEHGEHGHEGHEHGEHGHRHGRGHDRGRGRGNGCGAAAPATATQSPEA
jgi:hypothetical protein